MYLNRRNLCVTALMLLFVSGIVSRAAADDPAAANTHSPRRFEFLAHTFMSGGTQSEIFVKLDQFTGKAWRYDATAPKWQPILEPAEGAAVLDDESRYELYVHNYVVNGAPLELIIRVDLMTGHTWNYHGNQKSWSKIDEIK